MKINFLFYFPAQIMSSQFVQLYIMLVQSTEKQTPKRDQTCKEFIRSRNRRRQGEPSNHGASLTSVQEEEKGGGQEGRTSEYSAAPRKVKPGWRGILEPKSLLLEEFYVSLEWACFSTLAILSYWLGAVGGKGGLNVNMVIDPDAVSPLWTLRQSVWEVHFMAKTCI